MKEHLQKTDSAIEINRFIHEEDYIGALLEFERTIGDNRKLYPHELLDLTYDELLRNSIKEYVRDYETHMHYKGFPTLTFAKYPYLLHQTAQKKFQPLWNKFMTQEFLYKYPTAPLQETGLEIPETQLIHLIQNCMGFRRTMKAPAYRNYYEFVQREKQVEFYHLAQRVLPAVVAQENYDLAITLRDYIAEQKLYISNQIPINSCN